MSIKTKDELIKKLTGILGEDTSDDAIELVEDLTDTIDDYENRTSDQTDWKSKYEENDAMWRKKYIDRFNNTVESDVDFVETPTAVDDETIDEYEAPKDYSDLFTIEGE